MSFWPLFSVGGGAAAGAWLRWWLGFRLNPILPTLPLGTLASNLIGGYLMGLVLYLAEQPGILSENARLSLTTGFLGGLTTFSTFSAETIVLYLEREYLWLLAIIVSHVAGSLTLTYLGLVTMTLLFPAR